MRDRSFNRSRSRERCSFRPHWSAERDRWPGPGTDRWLGTPYEDELTPMSWTNFRGTLRARIGSSAPTPRTHPRLPTLDRQSLQHSNQREPGPTSGSEPESPANRSRTRTATMTSPWSLHLAKPASPPVGPSRARWKAPTRCSSPVLGSINGIPAAAFGPRSHRRHGDCRCHLRGGPAH